MIRIFYGSIVFEVSQCKTIWENYNPIQVS